MNAALAPDTAPAPQDAPTPPFVNLTRAMALASLLALIALCVAWELWLAPVKPGGSWALATIKAVPLLLPLPGIWRNRMYTYRWLSLLVWLYFAEGLVRATSDRGLGVWLAVVEIVLCLVLFAACAMHVRWRLKHAKARE
jgi:uncharacterized membrane protein